MAKTHLEGKTDRCDRRCKDANRGANMVSLHNIESAGRGSQGNRGIEEQKHGTREGADGMGGRRAHMMQQCRERSNLP